MTKETVRIYVVDGSIVIADKENRILFLETPLSKVAIEPLRESFLVDGQYERHNGRYNVGDHITVRSKMEISEGCVSGGHSIVLTSSEIPLSEYEALRLDYQRRLEEHNKKKGEFDEQIGDLERERDLLNPPSLEDNVRGYLS